MVSPTDSICLFTKDLVKKHSDVEDTKAHFEDILGNCQIDNIEVSVLFFPIKFILYYHDQFI